MSSVRKCKGCGWTFPQSFHGEKCRYCKTVFDTQWCRHEEAFVPDHKMPRLKSGPNKGRTTYICVDCRSAYRMKYDKRNREGQRLRSQRFDMKQIEKYKDMFDQLIKSNKDFKPMTEEEWHKVCEYFGGCAICGEEHIESREFFINFKDGGKYAAWNMFPLCGKCATHTKFTANPFMWLDKRMGYTRHIGITEERRQKMYNYFVGQIKKVGKT